MHELSRLSPGMPVTDIGYLPLGTVAGVLANAFELDLLDGSRVRLSPDVLFTVNSSRATVVCRASHIGPYVQGESA